MIDFAVALSVVKDVALIAAGITGTVVALKGLSTWKRQLRGQSDYEVARKVLRCTYRYRDAFEAVRSPLMWSGEMAPFPGEPEVEPERRHTAQQQRGYRRRLQALSEAGRALEAELLEAEVLWGSQVADLSRPLGHAAIDLETAISQLLQPTDGPVPEGERARWAVERKRIHDIVYSSGRNATDPLSAQFREAVEAIERVVRRHIGAFYEGPTVK